MLCVRLSSTLLLAATCLLMTSDVSTESVITCDDASSVHRLSCDMTQAFYPQYSGVISVQAVLYGRADKETCSEGKTSAELDNTKCYQEGTVDVLRERCDGKKVCELNTDLVRTSDPCTGIFKYLETHYICLPAIHQVFCENSVAHLHCGEGQVLLLYGADYGRRDPTTCSYLRPAGEVSDVDCSNPTSVVAESCNGKRSCTIKVINSVFGDGCAGTYKYLELAYICQCPV